MTTSGPPGARAPSLVRGYRFALDPTPSQEQALRSHCGAQRYAYNWGLRRVIANLEQRAAEQTYGISDRDLTPSLDWSAYALRRLWNDAKDDVAPWWEDNSKEAYSSGLANLAVGLRCWVKSQSGDRRGPRMRFPQFKSKKCQMSCRFTTGAFGLSDADRRHIKLPRIGLVRTHESTRKLARRVAEGTARIKSATISYARGRWFVSFSVEVRMAPSVLGLPREVVGVDLGIQHLAILSEPVRGISDAAGMVANPAHLEQVNKTLRRLQRKATRREGPDRRTGKPPSRRWYRAQDKVNRLHARVANARINALHRLTTSLSERFDQIVIEDLNIAGMLHNRRLARRIAGAGWGELRRQLSYKSQWRGGELIVADRFYASSKLCSGCGATKAKLRLSERVYHCETCGVTLDRDLNAARNLAALASQAAGGTSSPSCGATLNEPAGNPQKAGQVGSGYRHGKPRVGNAA